MPHRHVRLGDTALTCQVPELRIYRLWDKPIGPHTLAMFEVNLFTPVQFGAFVPWLAIHRGPLPALVHPNTDDEERDHSQRACWLGQPVPIDMTLFEKMKQKRAADEKESRESTA